MFPKTITRIAGVGKKSLPIRQFSALAGSTQHYQNLQQKYVANSNRKPAPVVIQKGEGASLTDIDGKKYVDMVAGFGAVSQGHCHPRITEAIIRQSIKINMTSRSLLNTSLPSTAKYVCNVMGYDMLLPQSTGSEACEAAVKLARKWAYTKKGVPDGQANLLLTRGSSWGKSIAAGATAENEAHAQNFGPHTPGFHVVDYNDIEAVARYLESDPYCAAVMVEPIQSAAGTIIPQDGYIRQLRELTNKHNCLLIVDEVSTGLGRTGKMLGSDWDLEEHGYKPDVVIVGKALSGGVTPTSGILCDDHIMNTLKLGDHGSTFGGNPLCMAIAKTALAIIVEEDLAARANETGTYMLGKLQGLESSMVQHVRGRGLLASLDVKKDSNVNAHDLSDIMRNYGVLAEPTKDHSIRFTPPLVIQKSEVDFAVEVLEQSLWDLEKLNDSKAKKTYM